jgi:hypothetical protein
MDPDPQFETADNAVSEIHGNCKLLEEFLYSLISIRFAVGYQTTVEGMSPLCGAYVASLIAEITNC